MEWIFFKADPFGLVPMVIGGTPLFADLSFLKHWKRSPIYF